LPEKLVTRDVLRAPRPTCGVPLVWNARRVGQGKRGGGFWLWGRLLAKRKRGGRKKCCKCCSLLRYLPQPVYQNGIFEGAKITSGRLLSLQPMARLHQSFSVSPYLQSSVSFRLRPTGEASMLALHFVEATAAARQRAVPIACRNHTLVETASRRLLNGGAGSSRYPGRYLRHCETSRFQRSSRRLPACGRLPSRRASV
jgi:hypothetical protein